MKKKFAVKKSVILNRGFSGEESREILRCAQDDTAGTADYKFSGWIS